ncbi:hypothetical protein LCGC14_1262550 [marine sediment metagenome]|uniref:Uncharacterized protein n=1 Tax=marine sediment metagenome TaxID=412755 RepID=A0A0F9LLL6_9ZZZZ
MPLTAKGKRVLAAMVKTYGSVKAARRVFHASVNAGKIRGVERRKHKS